MSSHAPWLSPSSREVSPIAGPRSLGRPPENLRQAYRKGAAPHRSLLPLSSNPSPSCKLDDLPDLCRWGARRLVSRDIEKIQRECWEHGIEPPVYDFGMAGLMLTFHADPAHLQAYGDRTVTPQVAP